MNRQQGISLPELLIALLLSSLIMVILTRHYITVKQQYNRMQALLERSIELQWVSDLIRDSTRRAGFTPCSGLDHLVTFNGIDEHKKLLAIEVGEGAPSFLRMSRMSEHFDTVIQKINPTMLLTTSEQTMRRDQAILIADCYHAEVQKLSHAMQSTGGQILTFSKPLSFVYHDPVYVGEWLEETYTIRPQAHGNSALFYHFHHTEELTKAIHSLSTHLVKHQGQMFVHVVLGVDDAHQLELETRIRAL